MRWGEGSLGAGLLQRSTGFRTEKTLDAFQGGKTLLWVYKGFPTVTVVGQRLWSAVSAMDAEALGSEASNSDPRGVRVTAEPRDTAERRPAPSSTTRTGKWHSAFGSRVGKREASERAHIEPRPCTCGPVWSEGGGLHIGMGYP